MATQDPVTEESAMTPLAARVSKSDKELIELAAYLSCTGKKPNVSKWLRDTAVSAARQQISVTSPDSLRQQANAAHDAIDEEVNEKIRCLEKFSRD